MNYNSMLDTATFSPVSLDQPNAWVGHLSFASWIIKTLQPGIFVELGTHTGNSYFSFCQTVEEEKLETKCYAVDSWQGEEHAGYYGEEVFQKVSKYNKEKYDHFSSLLRMTFDEAASLFEDKAIHLLHIDGLHTYEAVRHDFETWLPKLAPGAIVLFHDTNVRERGFGVWRLWEELQERYPNNLEFIHSHGLGVLQLDGGVDDKRQEWLKPSDQTQKRIKDYFSALGERQQERFELGRLRDEFSHAVVERDSQIASLNQAVAERDQHIFSLIKALEIIYCSRSWRFTKSLRNIATCVRMSVPLLSRGTRLFRTIFEGGNFSIGQLLTHLWHNQKNRYAQLKLNHPIWAEMRYGWFISLADKYLKKSLKRKFKQYVSVATQAGTFVCDDTYSLVSYASEYQSDEKFNDVNTDIKAIAFYLPQFHRISENDQWWGDGFTEWTNTKKANPRFQGHYQPRVPHDDIGYYDLSDIETLRKQASIARKHGLYGFCYYHYWFSGQRLLEKPVDMLLAHPDIDINFCLCWANENWTRTWDGMHKDILMEQKYLPEDPVNFIRDVRKYLEDSRYIRIDNKPVIIVYKPHIIPQVETVFNTWRQWWRDNAGGELLIWCNRTNFEDTSASLLSGNIDGVVEFPPHVVPYEIDQKELGLKANGRFYNYQKLVLDIIKNRELIKNPKTNFYRSAMLGWDNSARREEGWSVWYSFSLELYYKWLRHIITYTRNEFAADRRFLFINAWNEWAEGTYLEPDKKFGYSSINTTARALLDLPFRPLPRVLEKSDCFSEYMPGSIAVHAHIYFEELAEEMLGYLNRIPYRFDLFLTTDSVEKSEIIKNIFEKRGQQENLEVIVTCNKGRDVAPFLVCVGDKLSSYDYIGHFHSKKSTTVDWGDRWRQYLFDNLLGSRDGICAIFQEFIKNPNLGLIYPPAYPPIAAFADWAGNKVSCYELLLKIGCDGISLPETPNFPVGNMFWARGNSIRSLLEFDWEYEQFEIEKGQVGSTLAHVIERCWCYVASCSGYSSSEVLLKNISSEIISSKKLRLVLFAHYDKQNVISDADLFYLKCLKKLPADVMVISNSQLSDLQCSKIKCYSNEVIKRDNVGFDFGAWRDGIENLGWPKLEAYEEVILVNNSCYGSIVPLAEMFNRMSSQAIDFWSVSGFPALDSSSRAEAALLPGKNIPEHMQSYFMVFKNNVIKSHEFRKFWDEVKDEIDILKVIARYETQLTGRLVAAGFKWKCYLPESIIMQEQNSLISEYNTVYNQPYEMVLLRSPVIKKKLIDYAPDQIPYLKKIISEYGHFPSNLMTL